MLNDQQGALTLTTTNSNNLDQEDHEQDVGSPIIRDIHALTPPRAPRPPRQESWEVNSHRSSSLSTGSSSEINFSTMSREFNALVLAGSTVTMEHESGLSNLERIREEDNYHEDNNPLAIVPDTTHLGPTSPRGNSSGRAGGPEYRLTTSSSNIPSANGEVSVQRVKKEEVDSKISAWQNAKIAKINNRFKREDAVINGWEGEQVQKATSWMKKIERKLDEKRAKALEKMQNDIAKARRKAEERKASSEAKRGTKVARVLEISNLMRAVGRPPAKRSFF